MGQGTHRGHAGVVGLARGWPAVANSAAEELRSGEVIQRFGGDSGRFRSIPWAGRKRVAILTFSAPRRSKGQCLTAALGGELQLL
jgi:hypothetical protein